MQEYDIHEFIKTQLTLPYKIDPADEMSWQHYLYSKLGSKKDTVEVKPQQIDDVVDRIMAMAKVLYGLHMVNYVIAFIKTFCLLYIDNILKKKFVYKCRGTGLCSWLENVEYFFLTCF